MNIYLIVQIDPGDGHRYDVIAAFTDQKQAEEFCAKCKGRTRYPPWIEVIPLDNAQLAWDNLQGKENQR